jgi:hypothetical protein
MTETGLTLEATQALDAFLRSLPLSALAQTLSPSETITPQALAAAGLEARDDATFAPKTFASETIAAPAAHPSPSGARSLSSHADVALSDVSAAAATWTLPTLSIIEEAQLHGDLSDEAIASLKPDLALQETLGQGGMGVVKGARQCALGRAVAVKMLRPDASGEDKAHALLREALVMGQLEHPNVVPVYTLGQVRSRQPALVMKRVEGVSWQALIHDPHHPHWRALDTGEDRLSAHLSVMIQVCRALEFSHSRGIIHRDVKPENVMVGSYGEVYLLDWGIALHLDERARATRAALLGTPAYMAPEMARGDIQAIDARADVYLLGATLHEVLTGRPRHEGSSLLATLYAAALSAPAVFDAQVPAELAKVVNRATAADLAERFADVRSLREAIMAYLSHRSSLALSDEALAQAAGLRARMEAAAAGQGEDAVSLSELQAQFAACVFGFQMALRGWRGNEEAAAGLREVVNAMARAELARGDIEHAARLLDQHPDAADAALKAEVQGRLDALRGGRQDLDALIRLRDDLDINRNQRQRQKMFALLGLASVGLSVVLLGSTPEDALMSWTQLFSALTVMTSLYLGALWRFRRAFMRTVVDRRIVTALAVFLGAMWGQRLLAWSGGLSISRVFLNDLWLSGICALMMGVMLERRVVWASIPFFVGTLGALLIPERSALMFGLSGMCGMLTLLYVFRARGGAALGRSQ